MLVRSARRLGVDHEKIAIKYGPLDEGETVRPKIGVLESSRRAGSGLAGGTARDEAIICEHKRIAR
jgi:hypothetical protein